MQGDWDACNGILYARLRKAGVPNSNRSETVPRRGEIEDALSITSAVVRGMRSVAETKQY
jgi:hypothetical protein